MDEPLYEQISSILREFQMGYLVDAWEEVEYDYLTQNPDLAYEKIAFEFYRDYLKEQCQFMEEVHEVISELPDLFTHHPYQPSPSSKNHLQAYQKASTLLDRIAKNR